MEADNIQRFIYTDAKGNVTKRSVTNPQREELPNSPYIYLRAWDLNANATRTFREDRIQQIDENTDQEWLESLPVTTPPTSTPKKQSLEILFTGFPYKDVRPYLENIANQTGLLVRKTVTQQLDFIVDGGNSQSQNKIQKAIKQGAVALTEEQFFEFITTGALPGSDKTTVIADPEQHFKHWKYQIRKPLWSALGVEGVWRIHKEKTQKARKNWENKHSRYTELEPLFYKKRKTEIENHPDYAEWQKLLNARANIKIQTHGYQQKIPPTPDFHEGDIFYHTEQSENIQIVSVDENIEAKHQAKDVTGYHITEQQLANWLETGALPPKNCRIDKNQSRSEIAKIYEYTR